MYTFSVCVDIMLHSIQNKQKFTGDRSKTKNKGKEKKGHNGSLTNNSWEGLNPPPPPSPRRPRLSVTQRKQAWSLLLNFTLNRMN